MLCDKSSVLQTLRSSEHVLWFYHPFWWSMAQGAEAVKKSSVGFFSCMTSVVWGTHFPMKGNVCPSEGLMDKKIIKTVDGIPPRLRRYTL